MSIVNFSELADVLYLVCLAIMCHLNATNLPSKLNAGTPVSTRNICVNMSISILMCAFATGKVFDSVVMIYLCQIGSQQLAI
jgi:hypothetical protein